MLFVITIVIGMAARAVVARADRRAGVVMSRDPHVDLTQSARGADRASSTNVVATTLIVGSFVVALIPLTFIVVYVFQRGARSSVGAS